MATRNPALDASELDKLAARLAAAQLYRSRRYSETQIEAMYAAHPDNLAVQELWLMLQVDRILSTGRA